MTPSALVYPPTAKEVAVKAPQQPQLDGTSVSVKPRYSVAGRTLNSRPKTPTDSDNFTPPRQKKRGPKFGRDEGVWPGRKLDSEKAAEVAAAPIIANLNKPKPRMLNAPKSERSRTAQRKSTAKHTIPK